MDIDVCSSTTRIKDDHAKNFSFLCEIIILSVMKLLSSLMKYRRSWNLFLSNTHILTGKMVSGMDGSISEIKAGKTVKPESVEKFSAALYPVADHM